MFTKLLPYTLVARDFRYVFRNCKTSHTHYPCNRPALNTLGSIPLIKGVETQPTLNIALSSMILYV